MAIKKFFKDIFIVEYEEDAPPKEQKQSEAGGNAKVTRLEQSKKGRPESMGQSVGSAQPKPQKKESISPSFRKTERRQSSSQRQEKDKKAIQKEKETTLMSAEASNTKVCLFEPRVFSETQDIADELKNERAALVNLSKVDHGPKKRIVDFLSGTVYALDGDIQKVGADIFLCTPNSVGVEGEISEDKNQTEET
ncbi:cell division protein SepF [Salinicoccus roseus]|jgi:cell division inhibitor SepF|uniref:Cell division protein SepF n=1 Tax=Salinicoccus roseus TaxID=45670 RepID=A0A265EAH0_9STAP|nr:cell division protein SepF [Salinicoccus roseus]OZT78436.1 cell division protein SepF [Salinicoccus roseus]